MATTFQIPKFHGELRLQYLGRKKDIVLFTTLREQMGLESTSDTFSFVHDTWNVKVSLPRVPSKRIEVFVMPLDDVDDIVIMPAIVPTFFLENRAKARETIRNVRATFRSNLMQQIDLHRLSNFMVMRKTDLRGEYTYQLDDDRWLTVESQVTGAYLKVGETGKVEIQASSAAITYNFCCMFFGEILVQYASEVHLTAVFRLRPSCTLLKVVHKLREPRGMEPLPMNLQSKGVHGVLYDPTVIFGIIEGCVRAKRAMR